MRLDLNPIVIILNNDGYGTMRKIRAGSFNDITQWDYTKICDLVRSGETTDFGAHLSPNKRNARVTFAGNGKSSRLGLIDFVARPATWHFGRAISG